MSAPGAPGAQQPAVPPDSARVAIDQRIIIGSLVLVLVAIGLDMGLATNSASRAPHSHSGRGVQQNKFMHKDACSGNVCTVTCDSANISMPVMPPGVGN